MGIENARKFMSPNIGYGPNFSILYIGLENKICVVEPTSGFWSIINTDSIPKTIKELSLKFKQIEDELTKEMEFLRFGLKPSAVYLNPSERCNLNCTYCYLPKNIRKNGKVTTKKELQFYIKRLHEYFSSNMIEKSVKPQIIFHGSEPMIAKHNVFEIIEEFDHHFTFGIQTNGTLLTQEDISFIKEKEISIGISLDGTSQDISDVTRKGWDGKGTFKKVLQVIENFHNYPKLSVIVTVTRHNLYNLVDLIDFFHKLGIATIMLNPVRCTQKGGFDLKPEDEELLKCFIDALDRSYELFKKTGQKVVVSNFANILAGILGPTTRKLMCDISPCGGGRCFFALGAKGDVFPCSEFIGIPEFNGGNLKEKNIKDILNNKAFLTVTSRKTENFYPCSQCAIRHFCGAPCPAEVYSLYGDLNRPSPYCLFYQGIIQHAFKIIANGEEKAYLWDNWENEVDISYKWE